MGPITASGRTFLEVENEIKARVKTSLLETQAYVSLGKIKEISITITGEVNYPGTYVVSGLSSLLQALTLAGGIKKLAH